MLMVDSAFDVPGTLGRLANNKNLYKRLLDKFVAGYSDYEEKISAAFEADDFESAVQLSHTMKGLAGNLGAEHLHEVSLALEKIAKSGSKAPEFEDVFEKFLYELRRALKEAADGVDMG